MKKEKIKEELLKKTVTHEGKQSITCANALEIAEKLSVAPIEVGKMCNEMEIRIKNCQLGCF